MTGHWEPHSSSIDFCEGNYQHSHYIVELHNTWSSILGISSFGVLGVLIGNPTNEKRHFIAFLIMVFIGLGSAGLHGSLHEIFQSSDELPMIYLINSLVYICAEFDAPEGRPNYPHLPLALFGVSLLNTLIYYRFQQIYFVFVSVFISEATFVCLWVYKILYLGKKRSSTARYLCKMSIFNIAGVGFPLWIFDMLQCECIRRFSDKLPGLFKGVTPHIVWHFTAGFSAYCAITCLGCSRMEELDIEYETYYILGLIPLVKPKKSEINIV